MSDPTTLRRNGEKCFQRGDFAGALEHFEGALRLQPEHRETLRAAAVTCLQLGRADDAAVLFRRVVGLLPPASSSSTERASALFDLAVAIEAGKDPSAAKDAYEEALAKDAQHFPARLNLCALLLARLDFEAAERETRVLVELHPMQAEAWQNRTQALLATARYQEAAAAIDRTLSLDPQHLGARCNLALVRAMLGKIDAALSLLDEIRARPISEALLQAYPQAAETLRFDREALEHAHRVALFERFRQGEWPCFELHRSALASLAVALRAGQRTRATPMEAFQAMVMGLAHEDYLTLVGAAASAFAQGVVPLPAAAGRSDGATSRRLRIGYLSPAFRAHPCGHLFRKLFAAHDRRHFEIFGYALGGDDKSAVRADIVAGCDHFAELGALSDEDLAWRIRADEVDILVELEGFLDDTRPRSLAMRPAPVQVSYAGMLGILEASFIDYRLSDRNTEGEGASRASLYEQPVFLPGSFLPYGCPQRPWDTPLSRSAAGLPEAGFVFCSFNAGFKFDPDSLAAWMRILIATPGSFLWLLVSSDRQWTAILAFAKSAGIDAARLIRATRLANDDYLARLRLADLFLDSFHCNAHTTALDALWMELPIVTLAGATPATRFCASALRDVGLGDLVAGDEDSYVALAIRLATEPDAMADVRNRLKSGKHRSAAFDPPRKAAQLEAAYRMMWDRYLAGLPPAPLEVPNS